MELSVEPLFHLALIWCSVYVAVFLANKTRLTSVLYFLALGSLMVNTGILPVETDPFIRGFADFGIILIMFALGFEESSSNFVKSIKRSWGIALFGAIAPFLTAYLIADYFWHDTGTSIMCALAMMATAVSLSMVALKSTGLHKSRAATGIMTSAILDDIGALVLVAILLPLATGQEAITVAGVALIAGKTTLFFVLIVIAGLWILPHDVPKHLARIPIIGRYGIKHVLAFGGGEHATLTLLLLALFAGLAAHFFGFHPAVGAYMAGLIVREEYFHFNRKSEIDYYQDTKKIIDNVAFSWIGPVFFVVLGTKIVFEWDIFVSVIPQIVILTAALFVAQILSAALAARYTGNFKWYESVMIGFGMLGRAELAFVIMDIAYVQYSILSTEAFYTLMATAFWLNVAVPITISWWKPYFKAKWSPAKR